jgi:hypothetical protein
VFSHSTAAPNFLNPEVAYILGIPEFPRNLLTLTMLAVSPASFGSPKHSAALILVIGLYVSFDHYNV